MDAGNEFQGRKRRGEDIDKTQGWMIGHQVTATFGAILPLAEFGLLERCDVFRPVFDPYGIRLPKAESIDRAARP
jgi:hypothetical protein